jgi:hypothetical protein
MHRNARTPGIEDLGEVKMNCEEFANSGFESGAAAVGPESEAAREHLRTCPQCAALYERLLELRGGLRELGKATAQAATPSRVEMRLRQEFRTRHKTNKNRDRAVVAAWMLAAATMVLAAGSVVVWQQRHGTKVAHVNPAPAPVSASAVANGPELGGTLLAAGDEQFALIPGALPGLQDETSVVRVQMQRGALGALGLSVNEEHANDVVQVDLLLDADGQPQAYRLAESMD